MIKDYGEIKILPLSLDHCLFQEKLEFIVDKKQCTELNYLEQSTSNEQEDLHCHGIFNLLLGQTVS